MAADGVNGVRALGVVSDPSAAAAGGARGVSMDSAPVMPVYTLPAPVSVVVVRDGALLLNLLSVSNSEVVETGAAGADGAADIAEAVWLVCLLPE
jgi:hypothetical protein